MDGSGDSSAARAVYDGSADRYVESIGTELSDRIEAAADLSLLDAFVERLARRGGRAADLGCGPGRVAAFLGARGIAVVGVDLSGAMLDQSRRAHPAIPVVQAPLVALPLASATLRAAVCWYSIIHTPPSDLPTVFVEIARVLEPGAELLVAFQAGDGGAVRRPDAHGTGLPLTSYRHDTDQVVAALASAGLHPVDRTVRDPVHEHESTRQAFVFAGRSLT